MFSNFGAVPQRVAIDGIAYNSRSLVISLRPCPAPSLSSLLLSFSITGCYIALPLAHLFTYNSLYSSFILSLLFWFAFYYNKGIIVPLESKPELPKFEVLVVRASPFCRIERDTNIDPHYTLLVLLQVSVKCHQAVTHNGSIIIVVACVVRCTYWWEKLFKIKRVYLKACIDQRCKSWQS